MVASGGERVTVASRMFGCSRSLAVILATQLPQLIPSRGSVVDKFFVCGVVSFLRFNQSQEGVL
jgi:hypothetical protein